MEYQEEYKDLTRQIQIQNLGRCLFIGELYKLGMMSLNNIKNSINQLLRSDNESDLEALYVLLVTVHAKLERDSKSREVTY